MSFPGYARRANVGAISFNALLIPGNHVTIENATFLAGEELLVGSVIGQVMATGKWKLSVAAAGDGSEVPRGVMLEYVNCVDETGAPQDKTGTYAREGYFNETALVFGAGHTIAATKTLMGDKGIHTRRVGYSG